MTHRIHKYKEGEIIPEGAVYLYSHIEKQNHPTLTPKNDVYRTSHPELAHEWTIETVWHYFLVYNFS
jgi:hypothetical protein